MDKDALQLEYERLEYKRRELVRRLYQLVDELEGPPFRYRPVSRFPFNMLDRAVSWLLTRLERWVDRSVAITLAKLKRRRG